MTGSPVGFNSVDKMIEHKEELARLREENASLKKAVCCLTGRVERARFLINELYAINVLVQSAELGETGLMKKADQWLNENEDA